MLLLTYFILLYVSSSQSTNIAEYWHENLELKPLSLPDIPNENIVVMTTRETHQFIYYGLDTGQIAIGHTAYFGNLR